jgi:hypothetical protein
MECKNTFRLAAACHLCAYRQPLTPEIALLFNVTAAEMKLSNEPLEDSVRILAGGYLASLDVYPELHCLVCVTFSRVLSRSDV